MITDDKEDEENVKRCESCLQILDPEIPLPSVRLLSTNEIFRANFVEEKHAVLNPKVSLKLLLKNLDLNFGNDLKY